MKVTAQKTDATRNGILELAAGYTWNAEVERTQHAARSS